MATDKKSDHVGNHGGTYTDDSGMSRQFTYIDYDTKSKIFTPYEDPKLKEERVKEISKYRESLIEKISQLPASLCPDVFQNFTVRGQGKTKIEWNLVMLSDNGISLSQLTDLCTLIENRLELSNLI